MEIGSAENKRAKWRAAIERVERLAQWHWCFAWWPLTVGWKTVWFEWYLRRRIHLRISYDGGTPHLHHAGYWAYELAPESKTGKHKNNQQQPQVAIQEGWNHELKASGPLYK